MAKRAEKKRQPLNRDQEYEYTFAILFVVALVASFFLPISNSKYQTSAAPGNSNSNGPFKTLNSNYDFHQTRTSNFLVPEAWYFSSQSLNNFPFQATGDLTPWDTKQMYLSSNGLYLSDVDYRTSIFTPVFKINSKSGSILKLTIVYTKPETVSFGCCAEGKIFYSDGTSEIGSSLVDIDGRNPSQSTCIDSFPTTSPCSVSSSVSGNTVSITTTFYPNLQNGNIGLIYYPSGGGIGDVTINQIKLDALTSPGQVK